MSNQFAERWLENTLRTRGMTRAGNIHSNKSSNEAGPAEAFASPAE